MNTVTIHDDDREDQLSQDHDQPNPNDNINNNIPSPASITSPSSTTIAIAASPSPQQQPQTRLIQEMEMQRTSSVSSDTSYAAYATPKGSLSSVGVAVTSYPVKSVNSIEDQLAYRHYPIWALTILTINIIMVFAMIGWYGGIASTYDNPMIGPSPWTLLHFGAKFTPIQLNHAEHWRPFASTFLFAGIIHMIVGLSAGMPFFIHLERIYGYRMWFLWLISGWAGQLWSALFGPTLIGVGGSTAQAGIIGIFWAHLCHTYQLQSHRRIRISLIWSFSAYILLLIFGIFPFTNNWGHIAGMVVGFLAGLVIFSGYTYRYDEYNNKVSHYKLYFTIPAAIILVALVTTAGTIFYIETSPFDWCEQCHWVECINTNSWACIPPEIPAICFTRTGTYNADDQSLTGGWC